MPQEHRKVISCPECSGRFRLPAELKPGVGIACPSCGAQVAADNELEAGEKKVESRISLPSSLPPPAKKSFDLDISNLMVADTNRKFQAELSADDFGPKLDRLENVASTSDEAFVPVEEAPRVRSLSKKQREEILGWEDGGEAAGPRPTFLSTLKLALVALPLVVGVIIFALNAKSGKIEGYIPPPPIIVDEPEPEPEVYLPESVEPLLDELDREAVYELVIKAVEGFLNAKDIDERLRYTRAPERVRPLMEHYYASHPDGPITYKSIAPQNQTVVQRGFVILTLTFADFQKLPIVLARSGDSMVVDWESFVGYCEMSFDDFIEQKPTYPVLFRIRARRDNYFNFGFDEDDYFCLALSDLKITRVMYGYYLKRSELSQQIAEKLSESSLDFAVVKLSYPEDPKSDNQVLITEFVANGWLID